MAEALSRFRTAIERRFQISGHSLLCITNTKETKLTNFALYSVGFGCHRLGKGSVEKARPGADVERAAGTLPRTRVWSRLRIYQTQDKKQAIGVDLREIQMRADRRLGNRFWSAWVIVDREKIRTMHAIGQSLRTIAAEVGILEVAGREHSR